MGYNNIPKKSAVYADDGGNIYSLKNISDKLGLSGITEDVTYYVDGDSGDDNNDGLSSTTAKKTLDFLYSGGVGAIPRLLNAAVTVLVSGTVLSRGIVYHTTIDNFYGTGSLTITGTTTDVDTGIVVTGQDNTASSITYHTYLDASGESFTVDAHQGQYLVITGGTGVGQTLYPIMSNTATRLESVALPNTDGTSVVKIVSVPQLKAAQISDPSTIIDYESVAFLRLDGTRVTIHINKIGMMSVTSSDRVNMINVRALTRFTNVSTNLLVKAAESVQVVIERSFCQLDAYNSVFASKFSFINIENSVIYSSDGTGYGLYASLQSSILTGGARIYNQASAFYIEFDSSVAMIGDPVLVEECDVGLFGFNSAWDLFPYDAAAYLNFKNTTTAIHLSGGRYSVGDGLTVQGSGVTNEIMVSDATGDVATFIQLNAQETIQNSATGASVLYLDHLTYLPIQNPEYDNTTSGLTANNFQDAIDELKALIDGYHP